jgi:hypothetical protein
MSAAGGAAASLAAAGVQAGPPPFGASATTCISAPGELDLNLNVGSDPDGGSTFDVPAFLRRHDV